MMGEIVKLEVTLLKSVIDMAYYIKYKEDDETITYRFINRVRKYGFINNIII